MPQNWSETTLPSTRRFFGSFMVSTVMSSYKNTIAELNEGPLLLLAISPPGRLTR